MRVRELLVEVEEVLALAAYICLDFSSPVVFFLAVARFSVSTAFMFTHVELGLTSSTYLITDVFELRLTHRVFVLLKLRPYLFKADQTSRTADESSTFNAPAGKLTPGQRAINSSKRFAESSKWKYL